MRYASGIEHELELAATKHLLYAHDGDVDQLMLKAADEIYRLRELINGENAALVG